MLKDSITYWNSKLSNRGFFNTVICLAERIEREGKVYPAQYAGGGEYKAINLDSDGSTCYWRKNGDVSISEEPNSGGIGVQYRTSVPLKFVGFIPKTYADDQYFADNVVSEIIGIVTTTNSALKSAFKAKSVRLTATKYVTDGRIVGQEEYDNISFEPEYTKAYFSIDFDLVFVTASQCYTEICSDFPINGYVTILDGDGNEIARVNCGGSYVCEGSGGDCSGDYEIYVDGVLNQNGSSSDLTTETFNISA